MSGPVRIQLRRTRGWRMPVGAIRVDRLTKWGNSFSIFYIPSTDCWIACRRDLPRGAPTFLTKKEARQHSLLLFREYLIQRPDLVVEAQRELRGHDLGCWCSLDEACHADIWLKVANAPLACEAVDA